MPGVVLYVHPLTPNFSQGSILFVGACCVYNYSQPCVINPKTIIWKDQMKSFITKWVKRHFGVF